MSDHDVRFTLISQTGLRRHAAIIKGTFQIGKGCEQLPTSLEDFARAVLVNDKGGRFVGPDGKNGGVLSWRTGRSITAYELDDSVARAIGVPLTGRKY